MTSSTGADLRTRIQDWLPKVVLAPSFAVILLFVYGFILFTIFLSFTGSKMLPLYTFVGFTNYSRLWAQENWHIAISNIAIFASLYIVICTALGLMLAIFLDQRSAARDCCADLPLSDGAVLHRDRHGLEVVPRSGHRSGAHHAPVGLGELFLHLDQGQRHGCLHHRHRGGLADQRFCHGDVPRRPARHRQRDPEGRPDRRRLELPALPAHRHPDAAPGLLSAFVILSHLAIKSYDLVIALTGGGPGAPPRCPRPSCIPTFTRNQMGVGSASAVIMLMTIAAIMVPYLYAELKEKN